MFRKRSAFILSVLSLFVLFTGCSLFVPAYDFTDDSHQQINLDGIIYRTENHPDFQDPKNGWVLDGGGQQMIGHIKNLDQNLYFNRTDKHRIMLRMHAQDTFMQSMMPAETQFFRQDIQLPAFGLDTTDAIHFLVYDRGKAVVDIETRTRNVIETIFELRTQAGKPAKNIIPDGYFGEDVSRRVGYLHFTNDEWTPTGWYQYGSIYALKDAYYIDTQQNTYVPLSSELLSALTGKEYPPADVYIAQKLNN